MTSHCNRPFIPRDWRDHLARAINERDLARIEEIITNSSAPSGRTQFNDPLVSDAVFLLQTAEQRAGARALNKRELLESQHPTHPAVSRYATRSKISDSPAGAASWVAQPIAALTQSRTQSNHSNNNPLGNTPSLREKVSELREMALFPAHPDDKYHAHAPVTSSLAGFNRSSSIISALATYDAPPEARAAEEIAAAIGVPTLWVAPPPASKNDARLRDQHTLHSKTGNNISSSVSPYALLGGCPPKQQQSPGRYSPHRTRSASPPAAGNNHGSFANPDVLGAALRLHSFVHSEDQPIVKSTRVYSAFVAADMNAPPPFEQELQRQQHQALQQELQQLQQQLQPASTTGGTNMNVSVSPSGRSDSQGSVRVSSPSQSPEHHRLVRKLRHESHAPEGMDAARILRYVRASEAMTRGSMEQEELHRRKLAILNWGVTHSRGISSNRETPATLFMDN